VIVNPKGEMKGAYPPPPRARAGHYGPWGISVMKTQGPNSQKALGRCPSDDYPNYLSGLRDSRDRARASRAREEATSAANPEIVSAVSQALPSPAPWPRSAPTCGPVLRPPLTGEPGVPSPDPPAAENGLQSPACLQNPASRRVGT